LPTIALYDEGRAAKEILQAARRKIAESLNCRSQEIIFTSGGTESDNLAILGVFNAAKNVGIGTNGRSQEATNGIAQSDGNFGTGRRTSSRRKSNIRRCWKLVVKLCGAAGK